MLPRPGLRPMRMLPLLEGRRGALETCVFCPKLCRSACPVSNAEPRETITPWGKMSFAWMAAHGDVPLDRTHAAPAWACTGCHACREACDHQNPVADVLLDARDALTRAGTARTAPLAVGRVIARFEQHDAETRAGARALAAHAGPDRVREDASDALLVGCGYLRDAPREARDAVDAATALTGRPVALVDRCCGLPLRLAGDRAGFAKHAALLARSLESRTRVTVVDAGCAMALKHHYAQVGVRVGPPVELLVEQAARALSRMKQVPHAAGPVRWHDPCQLGRGLGVYDAPRAVLGRALGRAPDELSVHERREKGLCSGAGGLLPSTMPAVAKDITAARLEAHARAGGGRIVTACASSLRAMRRAAEAAAGDVAARASRDPSSVVALAVAVDDVDDLVSWIARALS
jgi:Fe-S oxidoreductase